MSVFRLSRWILLPLCLAPAPLAGSALTIAPAGQGECLLSYGSSEGKPWRVQTSTDLQSWFDLPSVTVGTGGIQTSLQATSAVRSFYRVREFPPDAPREAGNGPVSVAPYQDETWYDSSRSYSMPVRIYAPALGQSGGSYPLVILSHGLAGSIGAFDNLSTYLTSYGFICVMIQHDDTRPDSRVERPLDVSFALDRLLAPNQSNALVAGRIDASKIVVAGHSFGAFTALAVVGERFHLTNDSSSPIVSFPDARVKCAVAYSPQGATTLGLFSGSWNGISRPAFTLRGTLDTAPGTTDPETRDQPYQEMPAPSKYHLILEDAVHSDFSDTGIADHGSEFSQWYFPATLAFLQANLNGDREAGDWLEALTLSRLSADKADLMSK